MRLDEWAGEAPAAEAVAPRVLGVVRPVLTALGAAEDVDVWVVWGDEPGTRWVVLAPTSAGLVTVTETGGLTYYTLRRERLPDASVELKRLVGA